ncbi:EcsC family protein [Acinetobacter sp. S40]|uniref:EcsC family protein n=1 Tax=Acinetobacter sp. S40 TaxID=2767434 RepID=UPI00190DAD0F|nr:EcsC family protein [Acinetobacter sp. S40]MBJ9986580.1 EcsC family protein [Acinetobacter sp. S40]
MTNSNNNQSQSLLGTAFGVAKKLSCSGLSILGHVAPGTVSKINTTVNEARTIEGNARVKNPLEVEKYQNPQQLMRQHLPKVSQQLLGRHYNRIYSVASFLSPDINEKISDYLFTRLNDFTEQTSSTTKVLEEAGAKSLDELSNNPDRSQRISQALIEQNKILAVAQGAVSGATGVIGAAVDVPFSLALALRTIYQTGRAHGFELSQQQEQDIVEFIFKEVDLGLVAEKQTLLMAIKSLSSMLQTHDLSQFQQLLGSTNDAEFLKQWLVDDQGQFKYKWLNGFSKFSLIGKLSPLAGATVSAVYSWRLIEDAGQKAQAIFGGARHYLLEHPNARVSPLNAYLALEQQIGQAKPSLISPNSQTASLHIDESKIKQIDESKIKQVQAEVVMPTNSDDIKKVTVKPRKPRATKNQQDSTQKVEEGIHSLAEQYVEAHEKTQQQPALSEKTAPITDIEDKDADAQIESTPAKPKRKRTVKPKVE